MTAPAAVLLAVALVAAAADWVAVGRGRHRLEYVAKPAVLAAVTAAAALLSPADPGRRWWFVAAFACSLAGDVALMLPAERFLAGLGSFFAAHLLFVVGFLHGGVAAAPFAAALVAVMVLASVPAVRIVRGAAVHGAVLAAAVVAYVAVIGVMAASALAVGPALAGAGAALFVVSDTVLAWNRFVRPLRAGPLVVIVTYHAAQLLLAVSLAR